MARNSTSTVPAIEKKALAESNKSAGMRMLFEDGYTVAQVRKVFNAPYGYVYGVADRAGFADTAASRRNPRKTQAQKTKAVAAKVTKAATTAKAKATRSPKATAPKAKAGRPTAARRAANRAPRTVAAPAPTSKATKTRLAANR